MGARPITIVGGGLAGLTLGIALRRHEVPTTIYEAGEYPRHRVCGEFMSGKGRAILDELGLLSTCRQAGARDARTAAFFFGSAQQTYTLPQPALCLSRHRFDALLAAEFEAAGGELLTKKRWAGSFDAGIVRANGRRYEPRKKSAQWFGVKAHFGDVPLQADLEMHLTTGGYVGLCRLNDDWINVCGLFRKGRSSPKGDATMVERLKGDPGSLLRDRFAHAVPDPASVCAVAGISFGRPTTASGECRLGDALTMVPPLSGNGMSLALESAQLAVQPLIDYSRRLATWTRVQTELEAASGKFMRRVHWMHSLHSLMFVPGLASIALRLSTGPMWRYAFQMTR